ncbi:MAG TPA: hypothetical protein EYG19_03905, partial [Verrucomicrobia bacterium]|nr:hypothetical protein [Verrucomicrobiota bacterium]
MQDRFSGTRYVFCVLRIIDSMKYWRQFIVSMLALPMVLAAQEISDAAKVEFFSQKIFPILKENCFKCHGAKTKLKGGFRITSRAGILKGGEIGPAINLNAPEKSLLLAMLSYKDEDHEM